MKNNCKNIELQKKLDLINNKILNTVCYDTINKLKDINLLDEYKNCKSVKKEIIKLKLILEKNNINDIAKESIIKDYLLDLIPAGTKGVIRGNKFNYIIKKIIENLNIDTNLFEICFEKKCKLNITDEIPDWYILEINTNKIIIGMNQLDFISGGQQLNRGYKYLINNKHNTKNSKLLCVICNEIKLKSDKNKAYFLFEFGFRNDTLCYIKNIHNIINNFFNL